MLSRAVAAGSRCPWNGRTLGPRIQCLLSSQQLGFDLLTRQHQVRLRTVLQAGSLPRPVGISCARGLTTSRAALDATAAASAPVNAEETKKDEKKKEEDNKPLSWTKLFIYIFSGISGLIFLYYYRKANYSFHQTEVLLLERFRSFPLYYPPEAREGKRNGTLEGKGLPPDVVVAFAEWFVQTDLQEAGGVVRDDVLELFKEMGLDDGHQAGKDYLMRGEGQLEEHRRLTGAGLQESVTLLSKMAMPEDGSPCLVDEAGIKLLREKIPQKPQSVMGGAMALQSLQGGASAAGSAPAASSPTTSLASPVTPSMASGSSALTPPKAPAAAAAAPRAELSAGEEEAEMHRMEDARLARIEEGLLKRLNTYGALSPGEEARLQKVRDQRSKL